MGRDKEGKGRKGLKIVQNNKAWIVGSPMVISHFPIFLPKDYWFVYLFLAAPCGTRDLSSPTRDRTSAPCIGSTGVLTTGPPGKSQDYWFNVHLPS